MSPDTATQLLDAAQSLVQERGYNAFSYKDLATSVGIRTASIHYHFPAKADLALALMERYGAGLDEALAELDAPQRSQRARIKGFIALYRATEESGAICLCGSLAADHETLPPEVQQAVQAYLERSRTWLVGTLNAGVRAGEFTLSAKARDLAAGLLAALQGALILSRASGGAVSLDEIQRSFLANLQSP